MLKKRLLSSVMASIMAVSAFSVVTSADATATTTEAPVEETKAVKTKAELKAYVDSFTGEFKADIYKFGTYAAERWNKALAVAEVALNDSKATDEEVSNAYYYLETATSALKTYTKDELDGLVKKCVKTYEGNNILNEDLNDLIYSENSYADFEEAYGAAKGVSATDAEAITNAYVNLDNAYNGLSELAVVTKTQYAALVKKYDSAKLLVDDYEVWRRGSTKVSDEGEVSIYQIWPNNYPITWNSILYGTGASDADHPGAYYNRYGTWWTWSKGFQEFDNFYNQYKIFTEIEKANRTSDAEIVRAYNDAVVTVAAITNFKGDSLTRGSKSMVEREIKDNLADIIKKYAPTTLATVKATYDAKFDDNTTNISGLKFRAKVDLTNGTKKGTIIDLLKETALSYENVLVAIQSEGSEGVADDIIKSFKVATASTQADVFDADGKLTDAGKTVLTEVSSTKYTVNSGKEVTINTTKYTSGTVDFDALVATANAAAVTAEKAKVKVNPIVATAISTDGTTLIAGAGDYLKIETTLKYADGATDEQKAIALAAVKAVITTATDDDLNGTGVVFTADNLKSIKLDLPKYADESGSSAAFDVTTGALTEEGASVLTLQNGGDGYTYTVDGTKAIVYKDSTEVTANANGILEVSVAATGGKTVADLKGEVAKVAISGEARAFNDDGTVTTEGAEYFALVTAKEKYQVKKAVTVSGKAYAVGDYLILGSFGSGASDVLAPALNLAIDYINGSYGLGAYGELVTTSTGTAAEWAVVYRALKYALTDAGIPLTGKTIADLKKRVEESYACDKIESAKFAEELEKVVDQRKNAIAVIKANDGDNSDAVYWALNTAINDFNDLLKKYKYSYGEIADAIYDAQKKIDSGEYTIPEDFAAKLNAASLALISLVPSTNGQEAFDTYNELVGYSRLYTDGDDRTGQEKTLLAAHEALVAATKALAEAPEFAAGDVNGDGKVDTADALLILDYSVDPATVEGQTFHVEAADVNGDKVVDTADALAALDLAVKA